MADAETCGWGRAPWGRSAWGGVYEPPAIIPVQPVADAQTASLGAPLVIQFRDQTGINASTIEVMVDGISYVRNGEARNGAEVALAANSFNGLDLELRLPFQFVEGQRLEIVVYVEGVTCTPAELVYYFRAGTGLRLLQVLNPSAGVLVARFNGAMRIDGSFLDPLNWVITPITAGAKELVVVSVAASQALPDTARLAYVGGGSSYTLSVKNAAGALGALLLVDEGDFDILFPSEDEFELRLFDSIFGAIGISQRVRQRRTMDALVANRALALGVDEQTRLRFQQLDDTAGRDGRPGKLRT